MDKHISKTITAYIIAAFVLCPSILTARTSDSQTRLPPEVLQPSTTYSEPNVSSSGATRTGSALATTVSSSTGTSMSLTQTGTSWSQVAKPLSASSSTEFATQTSKTNKNPRRSVSLHDEPGFQPVNIALGKSYTVSYYQTDKKTVATDRADSRLTDGKFAANMSSMLWGSDPDGVFWETYNKTYIEINMDLKDDLPISRITYSTVANQNAVKWPNNIFVLVSDDGVNFYYVGDLVHDNNNPDPVPSSDILKTTKYQFVLDGLRTHGRYVKFVVMTEPFKANVDEIEIYNGAVSEPYEGQALKNDMSYLSPMLKIKTNLGTFMASLKKEIHEADMNRDVALAAIQRQIRNLELREEDVRNYRSVFPQPETAEGGLRILREIQCEILKLHAEVLRKKGYSGLATWQNSQWEGLSAFEMPVVSESLLDLSMMNGERRSEALILTNADLEEKVLKLRFSDLPGGIMPDWIRLMKLQTFDTKDLGESYDMLVDIEKGTDGYEIRLPAGMTLQLWVEFSPEEVGAGQYEGMLSFSDGKNTENIPISLKISSFQFSDTLSLHSGMWDYVDGGSPAYEVSQDNQEAMRQLMDYYGIDTPWARSFVLPASQVTASNFDDKNQFIPPVGYFNALDTWIRSYPNAALYHVALNAKTAFAGADMNENRDLFNLRVQGWLDAVEGHLVNDLGVDPGRMAMLLVDEPSSDAQHQIVVQWGRVMRDRVSPYSSRIQVFEDTLSSQPALTRKFDGENLFTISDIICVCYADVLMRGPSNFRQYDFYRDKLKEGKEIYLYDVSPGLGLDPYVRYVTKGWMAYDLGVTSTNYWSLTDAGRMKTLQYFDVDFQKMYSPLFFDGADVYASKRITAMYEGREDYEYLHILEQFIDYLRRNDSEANRTLIAEIESTMADAVALVTQGLSDYFGELNKMATEKDRNVAEMQRNRLWDLINRLSQELNINSFHKVSVSASQGGVISALPADAGSGSDVSFADNEKQVFLFHPEEGYEVTDVILDGESLGAQTKLVFSGSRGGSSFVGIHSDGDGQEPVTNHSLIVLFRKTDPPSLASFADQTAVEGEPIQLDFSPASSSEGKPREYVIFLNDSAYDINGDSKVDMGDYLEIVKRQNLEMENPGYLAKADLNQDGAIDAKDLYVMKHAAESRLSGFSWNAAEGTMSWTPAAGQAGDYQFTVAVYESANPFAYQAQAFNIKVQPQNRPPVIRALVTNAVLLTNELFQQQIIMDATDPDHDSLTVTASNLPEGAVFREGVLIWTPREDQAGEYLVDFTVSDGKLQKTRTVRLKVAPPDPPGTPEAKRVRPVIVIQRAKGRS